MPDRRPSTLIVLGMIIVVTSAGLWFGPRSLQDTTVVFLVHLIVVLGLFVFVGNSGVFSFGHVAFMAIGAYAVAICVLVPDMKALVYPAMPAGLQSVYLAPLPATAVAGATAALVALALSFPLFRAPPMNAALGTFAFLIIVYVVINSWTAVTNGSSGISGLPLLDGEVVLVAALLALSGAWWFAGTASCRRLRASREDDAAARAIGVHIARERRIAFVASAFMAGVAGALFAQSQGGIQPTLFYLPLTFLTLAMLVVGGRTSLSGAVLGAVIISVLSEVLARGESGALIGLQLPVGVREVGVALLMLTVLTIRPGGLMGGKDLRLPQRARRRGRPTESPVEG